MAIPIIGEGLVRWWKCPSCLLVDRTKGAGNYQQMHNCPALENLAVPLVEVSEPDIEPKIRHVLIERQDYMGKENAGRIMAVRSERPDGSYDTTVYAPTACVDAESRQ